MPGASCVRGGAMRRAPPCRRPGAARPPSPCAPCARSCVAISTVVLSRLLSSRKRRSSRSPISSSTFPVGSSAIIRSGFTTTARAIATRCFSPPDSVAGRASSRSPSPTHFNSSMTFVAVLLFAVAMDAQRQRHVLVGRQMVEQPEFLKHHPDAPAQPCEGRPGQLAGVDAEQGNPAHASVLTPDRPFSAGSTSRPLTVL